MNYFIAALIGLVSGITSGLFGVGGGIIMVPAMLFFLSPPIRDIKQAVGTSLVVIILSMAVATIASLISSSREAKALTPDAAAAAVADEKGTPPTVEQPQTGEDTR